MKKTLAMLVAAMMVFAIVGCSNNSEPGASGTPAASGEATQKPSDSGSKENAAPETSGGTSTELSGELNIFTWDGYFPPEVLEEFTARTGVQINNSPFESNEDMLMKLQTAKGGTYDIVLASDYIIDIARGEGLMSELDKDVITNYGNINPKYLGQFYDPDDKYTMPYAPGSPLIIYDPEKVDIDIKSYEDLWDESLKDSIVVIDHPRIMLGITLKTMGKPFNETDEAVLEEAKEKLFKLKPNIRTFNFNTPYDDMLSGETSVGFMFTSQLCTVLAENDKFEVIYPEEGLGYGIDSIFVPSQAPNKDAAMAFINFLLEPEIGAKCAQWTMYMNPNQAAEEFYEMPNEAMKKAIDIPEELLREAEFVENIGDADAKYQEIWAEFKQL